MSVVEDLARARAAYERREWATAYEALSQREPATLTADDFARLATAALLVGRRNDCVAALQRAYRINLEAGRPAAAVRCAFWLAMVLLEVGEAAVSSGWAARAERLLAELPADGVEAGYIGFHRLYRAVHAGQWPEVTRLAEVVLACGERCDEPDLVVLGLSVQRHDDHERCGRGRVGPARRGHGAAGRRPGGRGRRRRDVLPDGRDLPGDPRLRPGRRVDPGPRPLVWPAARPGHVHGAVRRPPGPGPPAARGVRRGPGGTRARGRAIRRDQHPHRRRPRDGRARPRAAHPRRPGGGGGGLRAGRAVRLRPQPGPALLWLAQGRAGAAVKAARRLAAELRPEVLRPTVLPAVVEIMLAVGEVDEAARSAADLERCALLLDTPLVRGLAGLATAAVHLAQEHAEPALPRPRAALTDLTTLGARYEIGCARMLLGRAYRALGDDGSATTELTEAAAGFAALGAEPALRQVARLQRVPTAGGLTRDYAERHRRMEALERFSAIAQSWDYEGWLAQRAADKAPPTA